MPEQPHRQFDVPPLAGRYIYLRPVTPTDYQSLRAIDLSSDIGVRWRFRGATPTTEQWIQASTAALAQFIIARQLDHKPIGLVTLYNQNFRDQHAYLAAMTFNPASVSPFVMMGAVLFVHYTFECYPFRKLYMELPDYNLPQIASGLTRLFQEEGRLRAHFYYGGRLWDKIVLALYREDWDARVGRFLDAVLPPAPKRAVVRRRGS